MALALAQQARRFAQKADLTGHSNYARFLVCGEVRALIAVGHYGSAHDSLAEAVELMATAPTSDHVGLNQTGMSVPEFDVSVATRYNELADADPRDTYTAADRYQAASYAKRAWPELDKAGATG
nr:hypothetical protein [Micromonospora sp. DSM 115978]